VFVTDKFIEIGPTKDGIWQTGRRVIFERDKRVFSLVNRKINPDGSHSRKVEVIKSINEQNWVFGVGRYFSNAGI
jgi:hypothetical protein